MPNPDGSPTITERLIAAARNIPGLRPASLNGEPTTEFNLRAAQAQHGAADYIKSSPTLMTAGQKAAAAIERLKANVQANYQDHYAPVSLYNEDQKQQFHAIHEALQPFLDRQFDAVRPPVIELDQVEKKKLKEVADKK